MPTVALASEFLDAFARHSPSPAAEGPGVHREVPGEPELRQRSTTRKSTPSGTTRSARCGSTRSTGRWSFTPTRATCTSWSGWTTTTRRWPGPGTGSSRSTRSPGPCRSSASIRSRAAQAVVTRRTGAAGCSPPTPMTLLLSFGVPAVLLPSVRAVRAGQGSDQPWPAPPGRGRRGAVLAGEGIPPEEVREAVAATPQEKVDPDRLAAALEHPDTKRRFVTIHSDDELAAMLEAPLEKWRFSSTPSQDGWSAGHSTARPESRAGPGRARRWWPCTGPGTWRRRSSPPRATASCSRPTPPTSPRTSRQPQEPLRGRAGGSRSSTCTPGPSACCGARGRGRHRQP